MDSQDAGASKPPIAATTPGKKKKPRPKKKGAPRLSIVCPAAQESPQHFVEAWWRETYKRPAAGHLGMHAAGKLTPSPSLPNHENPFGSPFGNLSQKKLKGSKSQSSNSSQKRKESGGSNAGVAEEKNSSDSSPRHRADDLDSEEKKTLQFPEEDKEDKDTPSSTRSSISNGAGGSPNELFEIGSDGPKFKRRKQDSPNVELEGRERSQSFSDRPTSTTNSSALAAMQLASPTAPMEMATPRAMSVAGATNAYDTVRGGMGLGMGIGYDEEDDMDGTSTTGGSIDHFNDGLPPKMPRDMVFPCGVCCKQGARRQMQDRYAIRTHLPENPPGASTFYGVFDGHGGHPNRAAEYSARRLCENVLRDPNYGDNPEQALVNGFLATDEEFMKIERENDDGSEDSGLDGTTAVTVLVKNGNTIFVANCGDSRAVLVRRIEDAEAKAEAKGRDDAKGLVGRAGSAAADRDRAGGQGGGGSGSDASTGACTSACVGASAGVGSGCGGCGGCGGGSSSSGSGSGSGSGCATAIQVSQDHKPQRADEKARIEKAGGGVWDRRVAGILSMSRAIGDSKLSDYVIAEPDVVKLRRDPLDQYIVLGSDGLWDVISNNCAARTVMGHCAQEGAERLVQIASGRGSSDNITALVIDLRNGPAIDSAQPKKPT